VLPSLATVLHAKIVTVGRVRGLALQATFSLTLLVDTNRGLRSVHAITQANTSLFTPHHSSVTVFPARSLPITLYTICTDYRIWYHLATTMSISSYTLICCFVTIGMLCRRWNITYLGLVYMCM